MELTPAFVLHHRPFRESSLLVDLFCAEQGRISLVARGVRQTSARKPNPFQPFRPLLLSWYGRGDLFTLSRVEAVEGGYRLGGRASLCGLYLNELLLRLLPGNEPEPRLYDAYRVALGGLQNGDDERIVLRLFEKRLLGELGYGLMLSHEAGSAAAVRDDRWYRYQPDSGPQPAASGSQQGLVSGRSLRLLDAESGFDDASLIEIKQLMRTVINYYLGGKPLHTRQLFAELGQINRQR